MIPLELLSIIAGLASAVAWGTGDFGGGVASKKLDALRVVIFSQIIGTALVLSLALLTGEPYPRSANVGAAIVAGFSGGLGLLLLYRGLAIGPMGVVAPLAAAVGVVVPVAVGFVLEGWPGNVRFAGLVLAAVAAWIIASPGRQSAPSPQAVLLALGAGLGIAVFLTVIAQVSKSGTYWPLVMARLASLTLLMAILLGQSLRRRTLTSSLPPESRGPVPWLAIFICGIGDTLGNILFVVATQLGRLDVAAVLSSLYPASTALLARAFLEEHLSRRQWAGVGLALAAIVLIAW